VIRNQPDVRSGRLALPAAVLLLAVLLSACGGGHSSPAEPAGDSLIALSSSPPEGTAFSPGSQFKVHVVLQYHLANGPGGEIRTAVQRADGSPLYHPPIPIPIFVGFPIPLIRADGTWTIDDTENIPVDAGTAVVLRCQLYPKGGSQPTASLTLTYPLSQ
jgi:hypothetical protein